MNNVIVPAVVIGGVAYTLTRDSTPALPPGAVRYTPPNAATGNIGQGSGYRIDPVTGVASYYPGPAEDTGPKVDLMMVAASAAYEKLDAYGRQQAADSMNQRLNLDPPLRGNEEWEQIVGYVSGAAGFAACNAIPGIGTAASPLCAIAASYLGVELERWLEGNLGDLGTWVKDSFGKKIEDAADAVVGWVKGLF